MADALPLLSQIKSLVQVLSGDEDGALQTQINFSNQFPIISQCKSLVQWLDGDSEGAQKTQKVFAKGLSGFVDGIPVVGHVKGIGHYLCDDREGGDRAMKSSSRTIAITAGGMGGFLVGGPVGAAAGGVAAGQAMDGVTTVCDSAVHGEYRPNGALFQGIAECQAKGDARMSGHIVDIAVGVGMDGFIGLGAGKAMDRVRTAKQKAAANRISPKPKKTSSSSTTIEQGAKNTPSKVTLAIDPLDSPLDMKEFRILESQRLLDLMQEKQSFDSSSMASWRNLMDQLTEGSLKQDVPKLKLNYEAMFRMSRRKGNSNPYLAFMENAGAEASLKPLIMERKMTTAFGPAGKLTGASHEYIVVTDPNTGQQLKTEMTNQNAKHISKHPLQHVKISNKRKFQDAGTVYERYELDSAKFRCIKDVRKVVRGTSKQFNKKTYSLAGKVSKTHGGTCQTYGAKLTAKLRGVSLDRVSVKDAHLMEAAKQVQTGALLYTAVSQTQGVVLCSKKRDAE